MTNHIILGTIEMYLIRNERFIFCIAKINCFVILYDGKIKKLT